MADLAGLVVWDVEQIRLSLDGRKLAFTVNENGVGALHVLDTATR